VETKWTGDIRDGSWFTDPLYEPYRQPGNIKVPFWLQPERHYVRAAWYQRDIHVPRDWAGKRVVLSLTRPHWESRVWVDDREVGSDDSLATPHVYDLTAASSPGEHTLTVRVDNRMRVDVGQDAHSVSDQTQTNWNGVIGAITLSTTDVVRIDDF